MIEVVSPGSKGSRHAMRALVERAVGELRAGAACLEAKVRAWKPKVVAIVGIGAYRTGFGRPRAEIGRQEGRWAGAELWALPNPSGLNAHYPLDALARLYRQAAEAAGVPTAGTGR